jgi:flagellin-specific chaperone FliS
MLDEDRDNNPYLQQEVLTASPIRLRWMLITRAKELCEGVEALWRDGQVALGNQWSIRIRDILGELLSGVAKGNPASAKVADFYLFLLKMLSEVEQTRDLDRLASLRDLLAYEAETWQLLLQKPVSEACDPLIPLTTPLRTHLPAPISSTYGDSDDFSSGSSFSLDV